MQSLAFEAGISHRDFWNMEFQEILNAHKGYIERELNEWRRARWLGACIYNAQRGKKDKPIQPTDLVKLPCDGEVADISSEIDKIKEHREAVKKKQDGK